METLNGLNTIARAQFVISIGETYDFEFVPDRRGDLRFELRANLTERCSREYRSASSDQHQVSGAALATRSTRSGRMRE
jgi:hypothetical protein